MNFFEQELRKIVAPLCADATYIGRTCYIRLNEAERAKLQFTATRFACYYDALQMTILNRSEGKVDAAVIRFSDIFGNKKVNDPNFREGVIPHIWEDDAKAQWNIWKPAEQDYAVLRRVVGDYLNVFQEQTQESGFSRQTM